jgi:hypothetical protein
MRIIPTIIGLLTGLASIMALWLVNPVIALLCIPVVARAFSGYSESEGIPL